MKIHTENDTIPCDCPSLYLQPHLLPLSFCTSAPATLVPMLFLNISRVLPVPGLGRYFPCQKIPSPRTQNSSTFFKNLFKCYSLGKISSSSTLKKINKAMLPPTQLCSNPLNKALFFFDLYWHLTLYTHTYVYSCIHEYMCVCIFLLRLKDGLFSSFKKKCKT